MFKNRIIKRFKKEQKKYPLIYPLYCEDWNMSFDNFSHTHICFARLCGADAFEQVCSNIDKFKEDKFSTIGHEDYCDHCIYNARIDFRKVEVGSGVDGIGLLGKPEIRLNCNIKLIDNVWKEAFDD